MKYSGYLKLSLLIISYFSPSVADSNPIVDLGYARYQGTFNSTLNRTDFLSLRYAAPPTGELRFGAPHAPDAMLDGVQESIMPPTCWGGVAFGMAAEPTYHNVGGQALDAPPIGDLADPENSSEDCLFVKYV